MDKRINVAPEKFDKRKNKICKFMLKNMKIFITHGKKIQQLINVGLRLFWTQYSDF